MYQPMQGAHAQRMRETVPSPYSDGRIPAVGDRVAVLDVELEGYPLSVRKKIRGRVGIVKCLTYPSATPVVIYPAQGRKKEFLLGQVQPSSRTWRRQLPSYCASVAGW